MTVFSPGTSQREQFEKQLRRGNIPTVCEGDCKGVGGVSPEQLADYIDPDGNRRLPTHEPCGERMRVAPITKETVHEDEA